MFKDTVCITYNSPTHERFQQNFQSLYGDLFYKYIPYRMDDIKKTDFYNDWPKIFKYEKYFGYFLWKPYIIGHTIDLYPDKTILYCDSNFRFNPPQFEEVFSNTYKNNGNTFLIKCFNFLNKEWTKRDAFILMDADSERYWNANQIWSSCMGFGYTNRNEQLLMEYILNCINENILTELPNTCGKDNLPEFVAHRWEQSIMSILVEKYNIGGIWDTQITGIVDKVYDEELLSYKQEIDKDPLKENEDV